MFKITVIHPFINDYLRSLDAEPLAFNTMQEMLIYMKDHNCTINDLLQFEYDITL